MNYIVKKRMFLGGKSPKNILRDCLKTVLQKGKTLVKK